MSAASFATAGVHLFDAGNPAQQGKAFGRVLVLPLRRIKGKAPAGGENPELKMKTLWGHRGLLSGIPGLTFFARSDTTAKITG